MQIDIGARLLSAVAGSVSTPDIITARPRGGVEVLFATVRR
ncbi:MAG TPA: hypothetical protein VNV17_26350 [Solirubrobacteraceae bacterium]|nr:hypothetical protein [Solirubrobacteraceae bacterium]